MSEIVTLLSRLVAESHERSKAHAEIAERFAPEFNSVSLLAPGETRLSEIFRWMLDETETHGQGPLFRDLFFREVQIDHPAHWMGAEVFTEVVTSNRQGRIDILLLSADKMRSIAIENKPWAGWQESQLLRYLRDQEGYGRSTQIHALIGSQDAEEELHRHWSKCIEDEGRESVSPRPGTVSASDYHKVANWLQSCAESAKPERVRSFLFDTAEFCRRYVMNEPAATGLSETASVLNSGGTQFLDAAKDIAAALPLALTQAVAERVSGSCVKVSNAHGVRLDVGGAPLIFVMFGVSAPWVGITNPAFKGQLNSSIKWSKPDTTWAQWAFIKDIGDEGQILANAAKDNDYEKVSGGIRSIAPNLLVL